MHRDLCTFWNSGLGPIPDQSDQIRRLTRAGCSCSASWPGHTRFPTPLTLLPRLSYRILVPSLLFDTGSQPNILLSGRLLLTPAPPLRVPLLCLSLASPNPARQGQDWPWLSAALGPHGTRRKHPKSVRRIVPRIAYFLTRPLDKALATHIRFSRVNRSPSITESPAADHTTRERNRSISTGTTTPPPSPSQSLQPRPDCASLDAASSSASSSAPLGPGSNTLAACLPSNGRRPIHEPPRVTRRLTA